jgi:flagellar hook-basal body complex protein FliE
MAINGLDSTLASIASPSALGATPSTGAASAAGGFADIVKGMLSQSVNSSTQAEAMTTALAQGKDIPLNEVIQAVSKAELTLQTLITVRDRAVEAYQQIQQMPI